MAIRDALLPEFDAEMASTRKTLERVPDDKMTWKPHPKSGSMGWLAAHLANLPSWTNYTLDGDSLDLAPPGAPPQTPPPLPTTHEQALAQFDKNVKAAREAIAKVSDEELMKPWSLLKGGQKIMTLPKIGVLRGFVMNHSIHHRAQLGVYLRLNDVPVPAVYGPSADEGGF